MSGPVRRANQGPHGLSRARESDIALRRAGRWVRCTKGSELSKSFSGCPWHAFWYGSRMDRGLVRRLHKPSSRGIQRERKDPEYSVRDPANSVRWPSARFASGAAIRRPPSQSEGEAARLGRGRPASRQEGHRSRHSSESARTSPRSAPISRQRPSQMPPGATGRARAAAAGSLGVGIPRIRATAQVVAPSEN